MSTTQTNILSFLCGATIASSVFAVVLCVVLFRQSSALRAEYDRGIAVGESREQFNQKIMGR